MPAIARAKRTSSRISPSACHLTLEVKKPLINLQSRLSVGLNDFAKAYDLKLRNMSKSTTAKLLKLKFISSIQTLSQ